MIRGLVFSFRIFDRRAIYCESSSFWGIAFWEGGALVLGWQLLPALLWHVCYSPNPTITTHPASTTQEVFSFFFK